MADRDHAPRLVPNLTAKQFNAEEIWYVEIIWPDGRCERVGAFKTEAETADWIAHKSHAWLDDYERRRAQGDASY